MLPGELARPARLGVIAVPVEMPGAVRGVGQLLLEKLFLVAEGSGPTGRGLVEAYPDEEFFSPRSVWEESPSSTASTTIR